MTKPLNSSSFAFTFTISLLVALGLGIGACSKAPTPPAPTTAFDESSYKKEIEKWQSDRLATLTKQDGWLSLIGLYWLKDGENKFGSGATNPIRLPKERAPLVAGSLWLEDGRVRMTAYPAFEITANGSPVTALDLKDDTEAGGPTVLKFGTLLMNVIKRNDRMGVRVKDTDSRTRREFKGLEYYPIDPKWRIEARFEPYRPPKIIPITNVLSMTDDETSPGALVFDVGGTTYRIDPIIEKGETDLFVIISDGTTGKETYGAGRYLYVSPPDSSGKVVIDFNKAYSPPCAFTNYATCPLPPQQNRLPLRIEAGEKKYAGTVH
jgi:uncharacterized protein (DUF1684 family)